MEDARIILRETAGFGLAFLSWCAAALWFVPELAPLAAPTAALGAYTLTRIS